VRAGCSKEKSKRNQIERDRGKKKESSTEKKNDTHIKHINIKKIGQIMDNEVE
jgi:hypothetical protein